MTGDPTAPARHHPAHEAGDTHGRGHVHSHAHSHDHTGGHTHVPTGPGAERRILWAMLLTGGFMFAELAGGIISGSLALIADAGHMLTDVAALALAYAGILLGRRPADPRRSYGYRRLEVLAAFTNGLTLLALSGWILIEAAHRLADPVEILSGTMLVIAVMGLAVNIASFLILRGAAATSVNVSGALVHVLGDMLGSVAAIAAALVIRWTDWTPIDPILSAFVALLIIRSAWAIIRRSGHILLEGTPEDLEPGEIGRALADLPGVADVHHVHVWSLTSGKPVATLHLRLDAGASAATILPAVKARLRQRLGIDHSTVEIDPGDACADATLVAPAGQPGTADRM